jgi:hypothetical protein
VIFNDYKNCLWGNPTEAKELSRRRSSEDSVRLAGQWWPWDG